MYEQSTLSFWQKSQEEDYEEKVPLVLRGLTTDKALSLFFFSRPDDSVSYTKIVIRLAKNGFKKQIWVNQTGPARSCA